MDVDLALDGRKIRPSAYDSIRKRLIDASYKPTSPAGSIFFRDVSAETTITVKLDLITGEGLVPRSQRQHTQIQDMLVNKLRGLDLALDHTVSRELTGRLPDGSVNTVRPRIASAAAFLCMKAHALNERKKPKDAYDVYFCLRSCDGGPKGLAQSLLPWIGQPLVDEAVDILRSKFASIERVGPRWAAQVASEHGEDFEQVARDAFERMGLLLKTLESPERP